MKTQITPLGRVPQSIFLVAFLFAGGWNAISPPAAEPPNLVLFLADDLGHGDLPGYAEVRRKLPHLQRLAKEGVRFTDFYVAQPVCSASRAALLTGCYPNRLGIHGALGPAAKTGLADAETTLAELLKQRGYATAGVGKWHLGHRPAFLPTRQGFDEWFGLPYSNDMWPRHPEAKPGTYPPLPLLEGDRVVDANVTPDTQRELTTRFADRAVDFIGRHARQPFFLYVAFPMPHVPLFVRRENEGRSGAGLYGDVLQEIDDAVGRVLAKLDELKLAEKTLVIFTSDNGPWLSYGDHAGSAGHLREGKGTVWEGGVRVPFLARWPGRIPPGSVQAQPAMTIDLLPTMAKLANVPLPARKIDGRDMGPLLRCEPGAASPHSAFWFYYGLNELQAVRAGPWKLVLPHTYRTMRGQPPGQGGTPGKYRQATTGVQLFHLGDDPGETKDLAAAHPEKVTELMLHVENARADLGDRLTGRIGAGSRAAGQER